ncbi:MAG: EAL domain-containing protein [Lachnospiraceae bacterium]|nr:EAL domain-containing protein [Lachnospiraceae bacterium]
MKQIKILNNDFVNYKKNRTGDDRDYLTRLPNRRALYAYYRTIPSTEKISVMFIDVDFFKRVNDVYGHAVGDDLLRAIAKYLSSALSNASLYRIGGDEFVAIVVGERDDSEVLSTVSAMSEGLQSIDFRRDVLSFISFSIGIVANQSASMSLDDILNRCDAALYHAKENGRNSCVMYKSLEEEEKKRQIIEDEMTAALSHNEFVPYLLPKVNMLTSKVTGAEVLCRWNHWIDGLRMPLDFLTVFEKNGFIITLDFYMFEETCKMKQTWKDTPLEDLVLSINISTLNLYFKDLVEKLVEVADRYEVPHDQLQFEVAESSFQKDSVAISNTVKKMVEAGFLVTIDNFGAGNSSLAILTNLPVQSVDFEKEFIHTTIPDHKGRQILKNLIMLCKDLKLDVLAEGVESREMADLLISCGFEDAQGYYFSPPVPEEEFIKYALSNYGTLIKPSHFTFNNTLDSEDKRFTAEYVPGSPNDAITFADGPFPGMGAVAFPGGHTEYSLLELPKEVLRSDSYTIALWANAEDIHRWTSIVYVKYETGFASMVPNAWEGYSCFRIRDSKNVNGWHDASTHETEAGKWIHFAASYNAKTETSCFYINGELLGTLEKVPAQRFCVRFLVGGDVFQTSFKGRISDLFIYSEVRKPQEIKALYDSYFK